jgi:hypothetical protein
MKLSTALRMAATRYTQCFGHPGFGTEKYRCAVSGSCEVAGGNYYDRDILWRPYQSIYATCPDCARANSWTSYSLIALVIHFNDLHRWNFERIADFVEQFELPEQTEQAVSTVEQSVEPAVIEEVLEEVCV